MMLVTGSPPMAQVNANLKADKVEKLLERKKEMHTSAFKYRVDEIRRDLQVPPAHAPETSRAWRCS